MKEALYSIILALKAVLNAGVFILQKIEKHTTNMQENIKHLTTEKLKRNT